MGVNAVELARVNALSGCYLISTEEVKTGSLIVNEVSMPSRAVTSFLPRSILRDPVHYGVVSMPSRAVTSFLLIVNGKLDDELRSVNALSGCYLISTVPLQKPRFYAASRACFCRYLSEYSDNSCFSCMLTFWTYLTRCTYP